MLRFVAVPAKKIDRDRCESKLCKIAHINRNEDIEKRDPLIWNAETERAVDFKKHDALFCNTVLRDA
jgi:hypothetical protein